MWGNDEFKDGSHSSRIDGHEVDNGIASSEGDDLGVEDEKSDSSEDLDEGERRYKEVEKKNVHSKVFTAQWLSCLITDLVYSVMQAEQCHM